MMNFPLSSRWAWLALLLLASVVAAPPLGATCSCTVSATVSAPALLQVSGQAAGACSWTTRIDLSAAGGTTSRGECLGATTCNYAKDYSSACLRTGQHTASASCACGKLVTLTNGTTVCAADGGNASTTFTVNTTPTVAVSYSGPDAEGRGTLSVPFAFPNTSPANTNSRFLAVNAVGGLV
ncbi:MAG TPA: hypothetical protein VKK31_28995, partial [Thermoanaerobaculia bacterium]|nr:hypothetical protein [Thermoanaerobaculia bacterium]